MDGLSESCRNENPVAVELSGTMSLEGDVVPLEDIEGSGKSIISSILVGKVISSKILNKAAVKSILYKAWGEPTTMTIIDLGPNTFMFNFIEDEPPKKIMDESPWNVMGHLLSLQWWSPLCSINEVSYDLVDF